MQLFKLTLCLYLFAFALFCGSSVFSETTTPFQFESDLTPPLLAAYEDDDEDEEDEEEAEEGSGEEDESEQEGKDEDEDPETV